MASRPQRRPVSRKGGAARRRRLGGAGAAVALLWVLAATAAGADGGPPANARDAVHTLVLDKALPGGKPLTVYLDCAGGTFAAGLARAPQFSKLAYGVDASGLALADKVLRGTLAVTIPSDGYTPPPGKTVRCVFTVDAKIAGASVAGTFDGRYGVDERGQGGTPAKGAVSGTVSARPAFDGPVVLDLDLINAAGDKPVDKRVWGRRGRLRVTFKGGKPLQGVMHGHGDGRQVNYFEAVVTHVGLAWGREGLRGTVAVKETKGDEYVYTFDGRVVGDQVGGTFTKTVNGKAAPGAGFRGALVPVPAVRAADAIHNLELLGAVAGGKQLNTFIPCVAGRFGQGMGYSGQFNHTYHDVGGAALTLSGNVLRGDLKVTINPDPYVPRDHKPIACVYTVEATVSDGCVTGSFTGLFGRQRVAGRIVGRLQPIPPVPEPAQYSLKLEDGVNEGAPWLRRVYLSFVATRGKATEGRMSNNKGGWTGTFKAATVTHDGPRFAATIHGTVDTTRGPRTGAYTFKLAGRSIGGELIGTVETHRDGKLTKQGTHFMGAVHPAE